MKKSSADSKASAAKSLRAYLGTWKLVSAIPDGQATPADEIQDVRVVISKGSHTVWFGNLIVAEAIPFTIDLTVKPHATTDSLPDGHQILGITRLEGDKLTSCVAAMDQERPKRFASESGSMYTLRVFKRLNQ